MQLSDEGGRDLGALDAAQAFDREAAGGQVGRFQEPKPVLAVPGADRDVLEDHQGAGDDLEVLLGSAGEQFLEPGVAGGCRLGAERVQGGDADLRRGGRADAVPEQLVGLAARDDAQDADDRRLGARRQLVALAVR